MGRNAENTTFCVPGPRLAASWRRRRSVSRSRSRLRLRVHERQTSLNLPRPGYHVRIFCLHFIYINCKPSRWLVLGQSQPLQLWHRLWQRLWLRLQLRLWLRLRHGLSIVFSHTNTHTAAGFGACHFVRHAAQHFWVHWHPRRTTQSAISYAQELKENLRAPWECRAWDVYLNLNSTCCSPWFAFIKEFTFTLGSSYGNRKMWQEFYYFSWLVQFLCIYYFYLYLF